MGLRLWIFCALNCQTSRFSLLGSNPMQRLKLGNFEFRLHAPRPFDLLPKQVTKPATVTVAPRKSAKETMYGYITSVTRPTVLPPYAVADLYGRRWRSEELSILLNACWD